MAHQFLVVVDETPECMNALRFAARRAHKSGSGVTMLYLIHPEAAQFWAGIDDQIRAEAFEKAEARLLALAEEMQGETGLLPIFAIEEGDPVDTVVSFVRDHPEIAILVLGAGTSVRDGPGPLVSALTGSYITSLPCVLSIVPGGLTPEEVDKVC